MKNGKTFFLIIAYILFNAANFFYHFLAARALGPEEYAIVASLFSIIYLMAIASQAIQTTITKFAATFKARKQREKINFLFKYSAKKLFFLSLIFLAIFLFSSPVISRFLRVPLLAVIITAVPLFFCFLFPVTRGILLGLQNFSAVGWNMICEGALKIFLISLSIYFGWKAVGAITAIALSSATAFFLSLLPIRLNKKFQELDKKEIKKIYSYILPVLLAFISITMFYNVDILLVKHFFAAEEAGYYSVVSIFGKIIFIGTTAIGLVMFPKASEFYVKRKNALEWLKNSFLFVLGVGFLSLLIYFSFPKLLVTIFFGAQYLKAAPLLGLYGIFMLFLALCYILALYNLSIEKKKFLYPLFFFNFLQIVFVSIFHTSLFQVIIIFVLLSILLFVLLLNQTLFQKLRNKIGFVVNFG